ncbi:hypothetical protein L4C34_04295 [Vibrio profundum]|uniref:hypothetical protein n=1 Tax=Vibrio profundum TaxID=2910247 RepID=UPI003D126DBB
MRDASVIPEVVAKAFKIATSGIPGAVLIELPEDIAKHDTDAQPLKPADSELEISASEHHIQQALELLEKSEKTILLVGHGAVVSESDQVLNAFTEKSSIYSTYTFMGKGAISNLYPRSLHCVGMGMKDLVIEAFEEADLVICVGYDLVEYPPARWNTGTENKIIHISPENGGSRYEIYAKLRNSRAYPNNLAANEQPVSHATQQAIALLRTYSTNHQARSR